MHHVNLPRARRARNGPCPWVGTHSRIPPSSRGTSGNSEIQYPLAWKKSRNRPKKGRGLAIGPVALECAGARRSHLEGSPMAGSEIPAAREEEPLVDPELPLDVLKETPNVEFEQGHFHAQTTEKLANSDENVHPVHHNRVSPTWLTDPSLTEINRGGSFAGCISTLRCEVRRQIHSQRNNRFRIRTRGLSSQSDWRSSTDLNTGFARRDPGQRIWRLLRLDLRY